MANHLTKIGATLGLCLGVAACGGGGGGEAGPQPAPIASTTPKTYETLDKLTVATTSLNVMAIRDASTVTKSDWTYSAVNETAASNGATIDLSDSVALDGLSYARYVEFTKDGTTNIGHIGVTTATSDMPKTGNLTYLGSAKVLLKIGQTTEDLSGTSTVSVDLGAAVPKADINLQFTNGSVDIISVTGATISGSSLSGGAIQTTKNDLAVSIIQTGDSKTVLGQFYGPNATELAGAILSSKKDGDASIIARFWGKQ